MIEDYINHLLGAFAAYEEGFIDESEMVDMCKGMTDNFAAWEKHLQERHDKGLGIALLSLDLIMSMLWFVEKDKTRFSGMDIDKGYYNSMDDLHLRVERWLDRGLAFAALSEKQLSVLQRQASIHTSTFSDRIIAKDKDKVLSKLHSLIDGKRGKNVALVIIASVEMGIIIKPTYKEIQREFGNIGAESGYNKYMDKSRFTQIELEGMKKRLSE